MGVDTLVPGSAIMIEMVIYWIASMLVIFLMDRYALKRIGGKSRLGYKVLKIPKFFSMITCSAYTIVLILLCQFADLTMKHSTLTFLGLPYFVIWVFFMIMVFRRVRAETKGRNW